MSQGSKSRLATMGAEASEAALQRLQASALQHLQAGNLNEAEAIYREIVKRQPHDADTLNNLGLLAHQRGAENKAGDYLTKALAINASNPLYVNNLGLVRKAEGKSEEAEACHRKAIALWPDYPEAHYNLGVVVQDQGRLDEAENAYREATRLKLNYPKAHFNLATVLGEQGRLDDAAASYIEALRLDPGMTEAHNNLAKVKKFSSEDSDQIAEIEALLTRIKNDKDEQLVLHFVLGKIYDDCRNYDKAFAHYEKANALKHRLVDFDREGHVHDVSSLMDTYTPEFFQRHRGHGSNCELPIFIVGTPRSGTTLIEQVLAAHPAVHGAGELKFIGERVQSLPQQMGTSVAYPQCAKTLTPELISEFTKTYLEHLRGHSASANVLRVTDKMPINFYHIGLIAVLFPRARIIHCRRDPLDACLSMYFQSFTEGYHYSYDFADLGVFYRQYRRLMAHWRRVLPGRLIEIDYEDIVNHQEGASRQLVDASGLDWDDACLRFYEHNRPVRTGSNWQVRQPIYKTSVRRWKNYDKYLRPLKKALAYRED